MEDNHSPLLSSLLLPFTLLSLQTSKHSISAQLGQLLPTHCNKYSHSHWPRASWNRVRKEYLVMLMVLAAQLNPSLYEAPTTTSHINPPFFIFYFYFLSLTKYETRGICFIFFNQMWPRACRNRGRKKVYPVMLMVLLSSTQVWSSHYYTFHLNPPKKIIIFLTKCENTLFLFDFVWFT